MTQNVTTADSTAVLTGATSGIGEHVAQHLADTVDTLIVQGPEPQSDVQGVVDSLRGQRATIHYIHADFTELDQVRGAGVRIGELAGRIDLLVNNAGIPGAPTRGVTVDGNEQTLQVNYLAMVLLTALLHPRMRDGTRIVNVGSGTHRYENIDLGDLHFTRGYDPASAYYRSKFAVVAASLWLAEQLRPHGIDVITACPGLTDTGLIETMFGRMGAPIEHGARNILTAALAPLPTGTYIQGGEVQGPSDDAQDPKIQAALVRSTAAALGAPVGNGDGLSPFTNG